MNPTLNEYSRPFPIILSLHNDRQMSSLTQFSDLSLSEEFEEVFENDGRQGRNRCALGEHSQDKISTRWNVGPKNSLPRVVVKPRVADHTLQGKSNPNWKPMASLDIPPLRINRTISVEKSKN
jgi:hypothetical protein